MPEGPNAEKRPADAPCNAVEIAHFTTDGIKDNGNARRLHPPHPG